MQFDFEQFKEEATSAYGNARKCYEILTGDTYPYTLDEVLAIFRCYFENYERAMKRPHQMLSGEEISYIILKAPNASVWDSDDTGVYEWEIIDIETYPKIIKQHFKTKYSHCNYSILHFFGGTVRDIQYWEIEKGS